MGFQRVRHHRRDLAQIHIGLNGFPGSSVVKNLPAKQETWVQSLGWEDLLEKEMAICSSILVREIPWMEVPGMLQSIRSQRVRHNLTTNQPANVTLHPRLYHMRQTAKGVRAFIH